MPTILPTWLLSFDHVLRWWAKRLQQLAHPTRLLGSVTHSRGKLSAHFQPRRACKFSRSEVLHAERIARTIHQPLFPACNPASLKLRRAFGKLYALRAESPLAEIKTGLLKHDLYNAANDTARDVGRPDVFRPTSSHLIHRAKLIGIIMNGS